MARGAPAPTSSKSSSSSSSKKKEKKGEFHAPQRNLLAEGREAIQLMQEAYPALYQTQSQWNPKFAELEAQTGATRSRAETAGVQQSGTSIRDAIRGASPEIAASGDALLAGLKGVGPSDIESELNRQALDELKLGGQLSADEIRQVTQGSRAASSARGLGMGNSAAISEVMSRAGMAEARKADRRNFAAGVDANTQQRRASDNSYVLNAGSQAMNHYDPYLRIYGRGGSQATGTVSGPQQFGNYLEASSSVGQGNQAAQMQAMAMEEDRYQFDINRKDTAKYTAMDRADSNNNAAAARSSNKSAGYVQAGASIASAALLAFML